MSIEDMRERTVPEIMAQSRDSDALHVPLRHFQLGLSFLEMEDQIPSEVRGACRTLNGGSIVRMERTYRGNARIDCGRLRGIHSLHAPCVRGMRGEGKRVDSQLVPNCLR